jgi:DNA repair exonuclease SbcCD ATPase subunit
MRLYGLKMFNFMRFGEDANSLVFDITKDQKEKMQNGEITFDQLYEEIGEDPLEYVSKVKKREAAVDKSEGSTLEGIVGIAGMTGGSFDASNGSGKSTLFEAISYLMYDRIVRQSANTDKKASAGLSVVTKLAGEYPKTLKESYVEAYFEEDDRLYRLRRGRSFTKTKKSSSPIFEFDCIMDDEVDKLSGHRKKDTKKSLDQVIVEDYDIFVNTVMFGQNDAGKFLVGTDKVKKEMIIELLKLEDVVHGCVDVVRGHKKTENEKLSNLTAQAQSLEKLVCNERMRRRGGTNCLIDYDVALHDYVIKDLSGEADEYEKKKLEVSKTVALLDKEIKVLEDSSVIKEISKLTLEGKELVQQVRSTEIKKAQDTSDWKGVSADSVDALKHAYVRHDGSIETIKANKELIAKQEEIVKAFDLDSYNEKIAKCEKAASQKEKYEKTLVEVNAKREQAIEKISAFNAAINIRVVEKDNLQSQIDSAGDKDKYLCSECQSLVTKDHTLNKIAEIQKVIDQNADGKKQVGEHLAKLNDAKDSVEDRLKKIESYRVSYEKLSSHKKDVDSATEKICRYQELIQMGEKGFKESQNEIADLNAKVAEYKKKLDDIEVEFDKEIVRLTNEIGVKRNAIVALKSDASKIEEEIASFKKDRDEKASAIEEIDKKCGSLAETLKQMIDLANQIDGVYTKIEEAKKQLQRYVILERAFGLDGVQTRIVGKYLPLLNLYVKQFLDILSEEKLAVNLFVNDKSKVDMEIIGGTAESYVMLSGGEKMIVRLAVDVGLSLLSFSRTSKVPDMICLDEIFGPLDKNHTRSVFRMLDVLKERFKRVFLISHKAGIQSLVENNIIVEKDSGNMGLSRITGISDITV